MPRQNNTSERHDRKVSGDAIMINLTQPNKTVSPIVANVHASPDFVARAKDARAEEVIFSMRSRICRLGFHLDDITFDFKVDKHLIEVRGRLRAVIEGYPTFGKPLGTFFDKKEYPLLGRVFHQDPKKLIRVHDLREAIRRREIRIPRDSAFQPEYDRVLVPVEEVIYQFGISDEKKATEQIHDVCSHNQARTEVERMKYRERGGTVEIGPGQGIVSAILLKTGPYFAVIDEHCDPYDVIHLPARLIDPGSPYAQHDMIHVELLNTGDTTVSSPRIPLRFYRADNGHR